VTSGAFPVAPPAAVRIGARLPAAGLRRLAAGFALSTVAVQIAYPLLSGRLRDADTVLTVLVFCTASMLSAAARHGARWAGRFFALSAGFGLAVEAVGTATGFPFGDYSYAASLGPRLLGVPVVVPLAWTMMAYPALVVGRRVAASGTSATTVVVATLALAAWDVFLDPQMVHAGHWSWPGAHAVALAGVPAGNFAGWLLAAGLLMLLLTRLLPASGPALSPADRVPLGLYVWTYASSLLANLAFFGRPAVAVAGGLAMGLPVLLLIRARRPGAGR
jgi:putative membrane protein